jgi:hypothetical protein
MLTIGRAMHHTEKDVLKKLYFKHNENQTARCKEEAVQQAIQHNARACIQAVCELPILPHEAEITSALKMTSEIGNVAIGKLGGEANSAVKLT